MATVQALAARLLQEEAAIRAIWTLRARDLGGGVHLLDRHHSDIELQRLGEVKGGCAIIRCAPALRIATSNIQLTTPRRSTRRITTRSRWSMTEVSRQIRKQQT